jgi:hypothetical protein
MQMFQGKLIFHPSIADGWQDNDYLKIFKPEGGPRIVIFLFPSLKGGLV